jgi:hydrogenase expression/formation protein HypC
MCLAIPARISAIDGAEATVDVGGVSRTASLMLTPEARVGDYVYIHTGYSISIVDEHEALESLRLLEELARLDSNDELASTTGSPHSVLGEAPGI